jgi:hypothetical protein
MDPAALIAALTPLYREYKSGLGKVTAVQSLEVMWDVGDVLQKEVAVTGMKPHTLFREVYGKSEGPTNIKQRSYIPREFQGRCYRVRRLFGDRMDIARQFPQLVSLTCFREAMPFLDNPKYALSGTERNNLLMLLNNRSMSPPQVLDEIRKLQKARIRIANPRTQRLSEMEDARLVFVHAYNEAFRLIKTGDWGEAHKELGNFSEDDLRLLSRNTAALARDGIRVYEMHRSGCGDDIWHDYTELVIHLIGRRDEKERRRFRRVVPPERIARMAEMLFALADKQAFDALANRENRGSPRGTEGG